MDPSIAALLGMAADLAGVPVENAERVGGALLPRGPGVAHSTLNIDGSPLQVCVGLSRRDVPPAIRLIGDPAAGDTDEGGGPRIVDLALEELLESHGPALRPLCHGVLSRMLPADADTRASLPNGGAWLAADLSGHGLAIYATTKWGTSDQRWSRARDWLAQILPEQSVAAEVLKPLSARTDLVSAGIEGAHPDNARAKLYWRVRAGAALHDLGIPLLKRPEIADFLHCIIEDRRFPAAGIVGSVSFRVASGVLSDVKLDVCCHCVRRTWADWVRVLNRYSERHDLHAFPLADPPRASMAFVGLGLDATLRPRLNVYLKTPDRVAFVR